MLKKRSLADNFVFQFFYHVLNYVVPLIITPYITRVIGIKGLGVYQFSRTTSYYFFLLAMLGIARYGQRLISTSASKPLELRKNFWSLYFLHFCISFTAVVLYLLFVVLFIKEDRLIYYLQTFYVASAVFDATWFFEGVEDFKSVVLKNSLMKLISCVGIFVFVKSPSDLWLYTLITSLASLFCQVAILAQAVRLVKPIPFSKIEVLQHIKPLFYLSVTIITASLYAVFDKTLLGLMSTKDDVVFYEYSNRFITIPRDLISIVGVVVFPRACKLASEGDFVGLKKYMNYSIIIVSMFGFACFWGLLATSDAIAVLYYGEDYEVCGQIIKALAPNILITDLGGILRTQYLIPRNKEKDYSLCICLNAVINLVLSIFLIPVLGIYGAVLGTIAAELFGFVYQLRLSREVVRWKDFGKQALPFCIIGFIMFAVLEVMNTFMSVSIVNLVLEILAGAVIYCALSGLYLLRFQPELAKLLLGKLRRRG